jgi:hypothetical protein
MMLTRCCSYRSDSASERVLLGPCLRAGASGLPSCNVKVKPDYWRVRNHIKAASSAPRVQPRPASVLRRALPRPRYRHGNQLAPERGIWPQITARPARVMGLTPTFRGSPIVAAISGPAGRSGQPSVLTAALAWRRPGARSRGGFRPLPRLSPCPDRRRAGRRFPPWRGRVSHNSRSRFRLSCRWPRY